MISAICQSILARRQRNQGPAPLPGVQLHLLRALLGLLRRDAGAPEAPAGLAQRDAATAAASITEVLLCSAAAAARAGEGADGTLAWGGAAATPLAASRASAAAAVGITSSTEELVLALSCAAALAACQAQAHMGWADSPRDLPPVDALGVVAACGVDVPDRSSRSSGCQPPVVLPLVPLLGAIAASYLEAAEAALRRLNRRLSRPFTAQQQHQHDRHVCKPSVQASSEPSGDGGGGTCSSSGCGSSMCSGGASTWSSSSEGSSSAPNDYADCRKGGHSAAAGGAWKVAHARPWPGEVGGQQPSLLQVTRQAEQLAAVEMASCRSAAARLCGRRWAGPALAAGMRPGFGELAIVANEVEAAAFCEGALVALTAAAADTRCGSFLVGGINY
ncbi:hypothetical protein CHLRE_16g687630v5 [Chlamydomonas reinhardtii]|uniref:Uncharacterized protein n=1 Tax=Chlamydomonas reinhardtii TaxID=3055 RepID=A0A2K3CW60_CHLRE|nr:uncharacterized protein CHLRE_16g687630v5 [Chlamydomonas reinhardtii]XP_042916305.1 uncharacterized protein CHLRE_16g687630v5 [Chlamydomonas reinhardtii]PNW72519.1 hypothetical protein CHLRE_16g687630v5 [Chlamydomonas reinhardtii]PNW72520.1 hypothetical protein CHLRE_16g687630v5 [Chlamydomonas reinhardtii]